MSEAAAPRTTFEVLTLFPAAVESFVSAGLLGKAIERGLVDVKCTDLRAFTTDRHRTVDDAPFGGGAGMVIKAEPVVLALESVIAARGPLHRVLLTPSAPRLDQRIVERLSTLPRIALLCGRYEGIDDRVREHWVDECISLGDFVLGGGEVAALAVIEAVARLVEGVVGNPASITGDSFAAGAAGPLLEYPQYTRPAVFRGHAVPDVLLAGDHGAIEAWRTSAALRRTWALRPELRAPPSLPAELPIHLAIATDAGSSADAPAYVELVRAHGLAGLVLLGASDEELASWTRASAGRCPITAFADLRTLLRRTKPRGAASERARAPWIVALVEPPVAAAPADATAVGGAAVGPEATLESILDELRICTRAQPSSLVLVVGATGDEVDLAWAPVAATARASTHASESHAATDSAADTGLASSRGIVDPSRPSPRAALVERVACALSRLAVVRPR